VNLAEVVHLPTTLRLHIRLCQRVHVVILKKTTCAHSRSVKLIITISGDKETLIYSSFLGHISVGSIGLSGDCCVSIIWTLINHSHSFWNIFYQVIGLLNHNSIQEFLIQIWLVITSDFLGFHFIFKSIQFFFTCLLPSRVIFPQISAVFRRTCSVTIAKLLCNLFSVTCLWEFLFFKVINLLHAFLYDLTLSSHR